MKPARSRRLGYWFVHPDARQIILGTIKNEEHTVTDDQNVLPVTEHEDKIVNVKTLWP